MKPRYKWKEMVEKGEEEQGRQMEYKHKKYLCS